ncbi:hypothetical protein IFM89_007312 [Coptis chinensis]|uniref:Late embryogenesis abundant protein LEA-2 subgroup domain-containing protein n=1 Tax=Coptis chinensis TaxID=261450 RepID=A0A835LI11_9MAGN|nr:hypothetical protein IFM89_007312 [Coptis chinensis]
MEDIESLSPRPKGRTKSCCVAFLIVLFVSVILGVLAWTVVIPKNPTYKIVDLHIPIVANGNHGDNNQNTTSPNNTNQNQNTTIIFRLQVTNRNYLYGIYYDGINVSLYHANHNIGGTTIRAFVQDPGTHQFLGTVSADERNFVLSEFFKGAAELRVVFGTRIRYRILGFKTEPRGMQLHDRVLIGKDGTYFRS